MRVYKIPVRIIDEAIENKTLVMGQKTGDRGLTTNKTLVSISKLASVKIKYYKTIVHCIKLLKLNKIFATIYKTPVRIIEEAIAKENLDKILVHYIKYLSLNKTFMRIYKTPVRIIDEAIAKWRSQGGRAKRCVSLCRRQVILSIAKDDLDKILVHYIKYL